MAFRILVVAWLCCGGLVGYAGAENQCRFCHEGHYAAVSECVACHRGDVRSRRIEIAHRGLIGARFAAFGLAEDPGTAAGVKWVGSLACRRCHLLGGDGNPLAVSLDSVFHEMTPDELDTALRRPAESMPDFRLNESQREAVVRALLKMSRGAPPSTVEVPRVVHFAEKGGQDNPFERYCGSCHRTLTLRYGALGRGDTAPNLSGLFSKFFPPPLPDRQWDAERLRRWLENPRKLLADAAMPPQRFDHPRVRDELIAVFASDR